MKIGVNVNRIICNQNLKNFVVIFLVRLAVKMGKTRVTPAKKIEIYKKIRVAHVKKIILMMVSNVLIKKLKKSKQTFSLQMRNKMFYY